MSAGAFQLSVYQLDNTANAASIRVQPETLALTLGGVANAPPAGAANVPGSAKVSGGARSIGINARMVRITFGATPPTGYSANSTIALPWLVPATFNALAGAGVTGTYLGAAVTLVGKSPERIR